MNLVVRYDERLYGAHFGSDAPSRHAPIAFDLEARCGLAQLVRDGSVDVTGTVDARALASRAVVSGRVSMRFDLSRRIEVLYIVSWTSDDGELLRLRAMRRVELSKLQPSLTVVTGHIEDEGGNEKARVTLRYDVRSELGRSLRSIRLDVG